MASNLANIQATMQQAAQGGAPMPPGAPPGAAPAQGADPQQEALKVVQMAWQAGAQGVPFEQFVQQLMGAQSPGPAPGPGGPM